MLVFSKWFVQVGHQGLGPTKPTVLSKTCPGRGISQPKSKSMLESELSNLNERLWDCGQLTRLHPRFYHL